MRIIFRLYIIFYFFLLTLCCSCDEKLEELPGEWQGTASTNTQLVLTFAGDLMAHSTNFKMKGFDRIYENLFGILNSDDISFVNLETPVVESRAYETFPTFNIHSEYLDAAIQGGFDVFSLANNHSYDQGKTGTKATYEALTLAQSRWSEKNRELYFSGMRSPTETSNSLPTPIIFVKNGVRIGFLACTEFLNIGGDDGKTYLFDYAIASKKKIVLDTLIELRQKVDLVILSYHAGVEYSQTPTKVFSDFAQELCEIGVDVLWAHHPHVLQPWKVLNSKKGGKMIWMPSMGNFVSGQTAGLDANSYNLPRAWTGDGALMRITFSFDLLAESKITATKIEPILIGHFTDPRGGVIIMPYERLLNIASSSWRKYYAKRLEQVLKFYPQSQTSHDSMMHLPPFLGAHLGETNGSNL